ncbi:BTB/POZ protein [Gigaspora margarita]|uniref:BTB/POZ protein n=1 Tax=Gigaspora margarita TaxID=4874 RepID=A0A8H3XED3_GIGMA|nr:BTB/POZ protein [Gigaspora margarita]
MKYDFPESFVRDYDKLLKDGQCSDVIIRVGEEQKEFRAHSLMLRARSTYFNTALSATWAKKEGDFFVLSVPNIHVYIFEIILRYMYTTEIILDALEGVKVLELLVAVDELLLRDFIDKLKLFIHQKLENLIKQDAISVLEMFFQYDICESFREPCLHLICTYPDTLFMHHNFIQLEKSLLIHILQCDSLGTLNEIEIWNYLLKWGIAQDETLQNKEIKSWKINDYIILKNIIHECIYLIRWHMIPPNEFWKNRSFLKNILSEELYKELGEYYLDPTTPLKDVVPRLRKLPITDKNAKKKKFEDLSCIDLTKVNEKLLNEEDDCDVIIHAGKGLYLKELYAHSLILNIRSSYFNHALTNNQVKKEGKYFVFQFPNISANIFEIILRYIYTATITFYGLKGVETLQLLIAANELHLEDIISPLISFIRQEFEEFMKQDAVNITQIVFQYDACNLLQEICLHYICTYPKALFENQKFTQLDQTLLIHILKCDDLGKLNELEIWNYLFTWGIEQNPTLQKKDVETWNTDDYVMLENTIHECIPLIHWFQISGREFKRNLSVFKNTLSSELYQNIWNYHLDSDSLPHDVTILPPRHIQVHMPLIRSQHFNIIASWIDKKDLQKMPPNDTYYSFHNNPYDFNLIYCSKRDGFEKFHDFCDDKGPTIIIAKVQINESDTCLFGGYNDLSWKNYNNKSSQKKISYSRSDKNFLFSFDNKEDYSTSKLARVKKGKIAVGYDSETGPFFGSSKSYYEISISGDLIISSKNKIIRYGTNYPDFKKFAKLQNIDNCKVEDYEVWKINIKKGNI